MKFVSLHGHSSHSTGDGHGTPMDHVERVAKLGMKAVALTEHGNVSSHVQLEKAANKLGIKPIFGCEVYVANPGERRKFHQTVLAANEQGYRQLSKLVSMSWSEGYYYDPTVHPEWLLDPKMTSDLIVLSGCADSWLSCLLDGGKSISEEKGPRDTQDAYALAETFQEVYGERYFLEVQRFKNYDRTVRLNREIREMSRELEIPMVATADVHYPHPDDWEVQRMANSIGWNVPVDQLAEQRDYEASRTTYPETDKEIVLDLIETGLTKQEAVQAVKNTAKVADMCNVVLPKTAPVRYSGSDGTPEHAQKLLVQAIKEGIKYRAETNGDFRDDYSQRRGEYMERIKKELRTILPKDFADYFLINREIIGWAKDNGIAVGPGRGSAAGSLVCYLLRLTEVNPMKYPMMVFERFLDPGRADFPDIDTDYQDDRRNEVFEYARQKYGFENVGNIGNFSRFRGKSAVKAAAKALQIPPNVAEEYASYITEAPFGDAREFDTAEDAAEAFPEAKEILREYPDLKLAFKLEGDQRSLGIHAAGMVISNEPIYNTCAIYKREKTNGEITEVIAYDKRDAEYLNMLKLDCLGLLTMTIISDTLEMTGMSLEELYALPLDDEKVLRRFAEDDLTGIFQFEGRATRTVVRDIFAGTDKVPDFMTLADINALSRPGSLVSGMTRNYVNVERGGKPDKIHPVVDAILAETNYCLVYQEQVMKIGQEFGGLDDTEIGRLRKIIGAKQAGGAFEEFWIKFRDGAQRLHGASEDLARRVWDYMAASSSYLFNVAHAISYAVVAYWTMYLKTYHPVEFFAASLRTAAKKGKVKGKTEPQLLLLQDAVQHGLTVSAPHAGLSDETWRPNDEKTGVLAGFSQIPGIGLKVAGQMVKDRKEHASAFDGVTWDFFVEHTRGFGEKAKDKAVEMGRSPDPFEINLTSSAIQTVVDAIEEGSAPLQMPNATSASIPDQDGEMVTYLGHVVSVKHIDVIGEMRTRKNLTTEEVLATLESPELATKAKIICSDIGGTEVHVNVSRYRYPQLKKEIDHIGDGVFAIHVTGRANNGFGPSVQAETLTTIQLEEA